MQKLNGKKSTCSAIEMTILRNYQVLQSKFLACKCYLLAQGTHLFITKALKDHQKLSEKPKLQVHDRQDKSVDGPGFDLNNSIHGSLGT